MTNNITSLFFDQHHPIKLNKEDNDDRLPSLRHPYLDLERHLLITLAVLIPVFVVTLLCVTVYCIYRCKKRQAQRHQVNSTAPHSNRNDLPLTLVYNPNFYPISMEELPPAYEIVTKPKSDLSSTPTPASAKPDAQLPTTKNLTDGSSVLLNDHVN